jgi:hypothetical protein
MSGERAKHQVDELPSELKSLDPARTKPPGYPIWTTIGVLVVMGVVISIVLGLFQQIDGFDMRQVIGRPGPEQSVVLIGSRNRLLLMSINIRGRYDVRALDIPSGVVQDVSRGAQQATQPALSHSGQLVAYFVVRGDKLDLDLAEISGQTRALIPSSEVSALAQNKNFKDLRVCPWSQIWWSERDTYLAFFICSDQDSLVAVKNRDTNELLPLDSTRVAAENPRTLTWVSDTALAVVQSEEGLDAVWIIDIASGQKHRAFGP